MSRESDGETEEPQRAGGGRSVAKRSVAAWSEAERSAAEQSEGGSPGRRPAAVGPGARQVLAVAALFALLGGALVRLATVEPPPLLWTAVALALVAAAVVVFGADAFGNALGGLLR